MKKTDENYAQVMRDRRNKRIKKAVKVIAQEMTEAVSRTVAECDQLIKKAEISKLLEKTKAWVKKL